MNKKMLEEMIKEEQENIIRSKDKIQKYIAMAKENNIDIAQQNIKNNSIKEEIDKIRKEQMNKFEKQMSEMKQVHANQMQNFNPSGPNFSGMPMMPNTPNMNYPKDMMNKSFESLQKK